MPSQRASNYVHFTATQMVKIGRLYRVRIRGYVTIRRHIEQNPHGMFDGNRQRWL